MFDCYSKIFFLFFVYMAKNEEKIIKKNVISSVLFEQLFLEGRYMQILKKILMFKVPGISWKLKLCRLCTACALGQNCLFFGIELLKMYMICNKQFRKSQKVPNHSTLLCSTWRHFENGAFLPKIHFEWCFFMAQCSLFGGYRTGC